MDQDTPLFDNTKFSDLLRDIYNNSKKKDTQIKELINQLKPMIRNMTDATMMVPLIKEYLEVSVKNDDNLVKLTAIVQRLLIAGSKNNSNEDGALSDDEKAQLLEAAQDLLNNSK
jgi:hypothetical protein